MSYVNIQLFIHTLAKLFAWWWSVDHHMGLFAFRFSVFTCRCSVVWLAQKRSYMRIPNNLVWAGCPRWTFPAKFRSNPKNKDPCPLGTQWKHWKQPKVSTSCTACGIRKLRWPFYEFFHHLCLMAHQDSRCVKCSWQICWTEPWAPSILKASNRGSRHKGLRTQSHLWRKTAIACCYISFPSSDKMILL